MDPRFREDDESGAGITAKLELFTRLPCDLRLCSLPAVS